MNYEPFSLENIESALGGILVDGGEKVYDIRKISEIKYALEVRSGTGGVVGRNRFLLVKVPSELKGESHVGPMGEKPVFQLPSTANGPFSAFYHDALQENFREPKFNSVEDIKTILLGVSEYQRKFIENPLNRSSDVDIKKTACSVIEKLGLTREQTNVERAVTWLERELNKLVKTEDELLVPSYWTPRTNLLIKDDNSDSVFFNFISETKLLPPAYDALMYLFSFSDEAFRQRHFADLMSFYFEAANKASSKLTRTYNERQMRVLLPLVKFEQAASSPEPGRDLAVNISNFLDHYIINQEDIYEVLKNYLSTTDYKLVNYSLQPLSERNGHLGEYFHLDIAADHQGSIQHIQVFLKVLVTPVESLQAFVCNGPGKIEDFFYNILCRLYVENGLGNLLDVAPKCYLSRVNWFMVLEDLSRTGYQSLKLNTVLDHEEIGAIVSKLARFHASSIVFEELSSQKSGKEIRMNEIFSEYIGYFMEKLQDDFSVIETFIESSRKGLHYIIDKCEDITRKLNMSREELKEKSNKVFLTLMERPSTKLRKVLLHGDMYLGNILIKPRKNSDPTQAMLIDFQMLYYGPPSLELLCCIYTLSTKDMRNRHLQSLIDRYYNEVHAVLVDFSLDPEELFPRDLFDHDIKVNIPVGLIQGIGYTQVTQIDPDFRDEIMHDDAKMKYFLQDHRDELIESSWNNEQYKNFARGLMEDLVDLIENEYS
ncbi:uncharacterized protein [Euwallacea fornicatus]|uniref:uncharacterized protein n=1 Tax=Euwallacea fornicatus TaxID=995702 RepID=UPI00338F1E77